MSYIDISNVRMPKSLFKLNFNEQIDIFEIAVPLFEACNLNCKFCFESHDIANVDEEAIKNMPNKIFPSSLEMIKDSGASNVAIRLWGGELFFDALPDSVFNAYKIFIDKTRELGKKYLPDGKIYFSFLSNGVFTKYERVEDLLKYANCVNFALSYDPVDRFSHESQREAWFKTLMHFYNKKMLNSTSITLTKQSIDAYIKNDPYIFKIPPDIPMDVNYYTATSNWKSCMPSDDDLFSFYKWGIDNSLFNIRTIAIIMDYMTPGRREVVGRSCDCKSCAQLIGDSCTRDCAKRSPLNDRKAFYGKYVNEVNENNCTEVKNILGMHKRGCITCEHYESCTMFCWISLLFEHYKVSNCPLKRIYEYINEDHIKKYAIWREKNEITDNIAL